MSRPDERGGRTSCRKQPMPIRRTATPLKVRIILGLAAFAILSALILTRPIGTLQDFDQPFYMTIAYDLDRWGVFSNGIYADMESATDTDSSTRPPPGAFFGPVYPVLIYAAMKLDPRFASAVRCSVSADRDDRDYTTCEAYELPVRLVNALLLAGAIVAVATTAEVIFLQGSVFLLTGAFALAAIACEAWILSFMMTEATIFSIYSFFALGNVLAWRTGRMRYFVLSGALLGLLCLTKASFLLFFPLVLGLGAIYLYRLAEPRPPYRLWHLLAFSLAFGCLIGGWMTRNLVSIGKFAFTEEYGSGVLIERFSFNRMTVREFIQAFPYCTPGLGDLVFDHVHGTDSMHRFVEATPGSFFHIGRGRRDALQDKYQRLDPLIYGIVRDEMRSNWWRHLLVSIPLAWCGMWAGWIVSLLLFPLFACACLRLLRSGQPLFLLYAVPPFINLGLDAVIANGNTRYNLILIGPYAIGAAFIVSSGLEGGRWRRLLRGPKSSSALSATALAGEDSASSTA